MKNENINNKLLNRGNKAQPKKEILIAESKKENDTQSLNITENEEKINQNIIIEVDKIKIKENDNTDNTNPKFVKRLFNSVRKLNGQQKLVYLKTPDLIEIKEINEIKEIKEIEKKEDCKDNLDIIIQEEKKIMKVEKSVKIFDLAKKWDSKNTEFEEPIKIEDIKDNISISSNPKLMKRLFNTKRRIFGNEKEDNNMVEKNNKISFQNKFSGVNQN